MVSARPDTIWLARKPTTRIAWIEDVASAARPPIVVASNRTIQSGPVMCCTLQKAVTAPISIIPSTPRLRTPERSARSSPTEANTSGVP